MKDYNRNSVKETLDVLTDYIGCQIFFCPSNGMFEEDELGDEKVLSDGTTIEVYTKYGYTSYLEVLDVPKSKYRTLRHFLKTRDSVLKKVL